MPKLVHVGDVALNTHRRGAACEVDRCRPGVVGRQREIAGVETVEHLAEVACAGEHVRARLVDVQVECSRGRGHHLQEPTRARRRLGVRVQVRLDFRDGPEHGRRNAGVGCGDLERATECGRERARRDPDNGHRQLRVRDSHRRGSRVRDRRHTGPFECCRPGDRHDCDDRKQGEAPLRLPHHGRGSLEA